MSQFDSGSDELDFLKDEAALATVLARSTINYVKGYAVETGRQDRCDEIVRLSYRDGTPMVTIGLAFAEKAMSSIVRKLVSEPSWPAIRENMIQTPPLTAREVSALRSLLPNENLGMADIAKAGFQLSPAQLKSFVEHYQRYPLFFQAAR